MDPTTLIAPVGQKERLVVVDVLRGFALTGVLIANFTAFTDQQVPAEILHSISSPLDLSLMRINTVFLEWKFMTLFSILFGYGFGQLMTSVAAKKLNPDSFFIRRMFWLFVIGCIHTSFWWYDVLHLYAISGILLLLFRKASNRSILIWAIVLMFILPLTFSYFMRNQQETFNEADFNNAYEIMKHGNLKELMISNWTGYYKMFILSFDDIHDVGETLGRFLFGYFLLRVKFFDSIEIKVRVFRKILLIALPLMTVYFIFRWIAVTEEINTDSFYWRPLNKVGIFSTTLCYAILIVLLFNSFRRSKIFNALQALGKMTLTNYLLISAIMIILLYGVGFGKLGEAPIHTIWIYAGIWLLLEIAFSTWWLGKFRYGPLEWIWRQLTYGKRLPLKN